MLDVRAETDPFIERNHGLMTASVSAALSPADDLHDFPGDGQFELGVAGLPPSWRLCMPPGCRSIAASELAPVAERHPEVRWALVFESPERHLRRHGLRADSLAARRALTDWSSSAERLLRFAAPRPERVHWWDLDRLSETDAAASHPEADPLGHALGSALREAARAELPTLNAQHPPMRSDALCTHVHHRLLRASAQGEPRASRHEDALSPAASTPSHSPPTSGTTASPQHERLLSELHHTQRDLWHLWTTSRKALAAAKAAPATGGRDGVRAVAAGPGSSATAAPPHASTALGIAQTALSHLRALDAGGPGAWLRLGGPLPPDHGPPRWDAIELGPADLEGEHRHLEVGLRGAALAAGAFDHLGLRLVEHRGQPGLALLRSIGQGAPIGPWAEHGRDGDRSFCLLVPGDPKGDAILRRLGAGDWRFLLQVLVCIDAALVAASRDDARYWRSVVQALRAVLWQLPARLRYDAVEVVGLPDADAPQALRVAFLGAVFGWRELGRVELEWRPRAPFDDDASRAALVCSHRGADGETAPLWSTWPRLAGRGWAEYAVLPVGPGISGRRLRELWGSTPPDDRQLLLALLDALPAAGAQGDMPKRLGLVAATAAMHRQARRALRLLALRRTFGRLLRRP